VILVFGAWYAPKHGKQEMGPQSVGRFENPAEKADRIVLMNILNTFHLEEAKISKKDTPKQRRAAQSEHVQHVIDKLEVASIGEANAGAQEELLDVFKRWDAKLSEASSTVDLKPEFVSIAAEHSWLNTLVWIIILNRL
jgi:hypothetical protein